jgi:hypothetical protein
VKKPPPVNQGQGRTRGDDDGTASENGRGPTGEHGKSGK